MEICHKLLTEISFSGACGRIEMVLDDLEFRFRKFNINTFQL